MWINKLLDRFDHNSRMIWIAFVLGWVLAFNVASCMGQGIRPMAHRVYVDNDATGAEITPAQFENIDDNIPDHTKIYFESGETFEVGNIDITSDDVDIAPYRTGADPILMGSVSHTASTWTSETGGYYSTPIVTDPLWVTKDGEMSRQGESDWIATTANSTSSTITATAATLNAFNTNQALANSAKVRGKDFAFRLSYEYAVTGYNTGTGVMTIGAANVVGLSSGFPFKLYGQKQFATLEGDWWYDTANDKLWIKTASTPSGTDIRVVNKNYAFNLTGCAGCSVDNIEFAEYYETAIEANDCPTLSLTNLNIHDIRGNGVMAYGNSTVFTANNNTVERCGLNAYHVGAVGSGSSITNNTINEIGEQANIGWPIDTYWLKTGGSGIAFFWDSSEGTTTPTGVTIENNSITNVGYIGVLLLGDNHIVNENFIDTFGTRWNDGGGIYTIHRATLGLSTKNISVTNNLVKNGVGNIDGIAGAALTQINEFGGYHADGLYIDNGTELTTWTGNTVENCTRGVICNFDTQKNTINENTFFGSRIVGAFFQEEQNPALSPVFPFNDGNHFNDNTIVSNSIQFCVEIVSNDNDANYSPFDDGGTISGNYYVRPYGSVINISRANGSSSAPSPYSLSTWATKYGETGGTEIISQYNYLSPEKAATEVILATNETNSTINVDPPDGVYDDVDGVAVTNFDLGPYESKPYFIITPVAPDILLDTFTGANGTNISGRSPNIGPVPTIVAGTHAIQSNRMATTVFGIVKWGTGTPNFQYTASRRMSNTADGLGIYIRHTDANNMLIINVTPTSISLFERNANPTATLLASAPAIFKVDTEYFMSAIANGNNVKVFVDGVLYIDQTVSLLTGNSVGVLGQTTSTTDYVQAATLP